MVSTFWSNTIWYVLLACTSLVSIIFIFYKVKNRRRFTFGFLFAALGLILLGETIIHGELYAYRYFPKINKDPFVDSVAGNFFSQLSLITTSILLSVYKLHFTWYFVFAGVYYLIETLFIKLGIYQHGWYKSWYTPVVFLALSFFLKKWYYTIYYYNNRLNKYYIYYTTLFLGSFGIFVPIGQHFFIKSTLNFKFTLYPGFYMNQGIQLVIYQILLVNILLNLHRWNLKWTRTGIILVFICFVHYVLAKFGIFIFKPGWFLGHTFINVFGLYFSVVFMDYLLSKGALSQNSS